MRKNSNAGTLNRLSDGGLIPILMTRVISMIIERHFWLVQVQTSKAIGRVNSSVKAIQI